MSTVAALPASWPRSAVAEKGRPGPWEKVGGSQITRSNERWRSAKRSRVLLASAVMISILFGSSPESSQLRRARAWALAAVSTATISAAPALAARTENAPV